MVPTKLNCIVEVFISVDALTINNIELNVEGDIDRAGSGSNGRTVSLENVKLYVGGYIDANTISCSGCQINAVGYVFIGEFECSNSEIRTNSLRDISAKTNIYKFYCGR